jgi:hypothetical protein
MVALTRLTLSHRQAQQTQAAAAVVALTVGVAVKLARQAVQAL